MRTRSNFFLRLGLWLSEDRRQCNTSKTERVAEVLVATVLGALLAAWLVHELTNCARAAAWC